MPNILIVEDSSPSQVLYRRRLEKLVEGNGSIEIVSDFETARSRLNNGGYVAYVLDHHFPRQQGGRPEGLGTSLVSEIREREGSLVKVIFVSGDDAAVQEAKRLGVFKAYLREPTTLNIVAEDVSFLLRAEAPVKYPTPSER
jgi:DNA-binding response OmpR family regulator